jgi:hypothetical protein
MKQNPSFPEYFSELLYRENVPHLIVCIHNGNKRGILIKGLQKVVNIQLSLMVYRQKSYPEAFASQMLAEVPDSRMFNSGRDNMSLAGG